MITVALIDDDAMVRTGLKLILGTDPDIEVVGEASDGEEGLSLITRATPAVILLDIRMPVLDGLGVLERLGTRAAAGHAVPKVIVLTTFDADDYVLRALGQGAQGFLLKDSDPGAMIAAIKAVHRGEPALSSSVTSTVIAAATHRPRVDPGRADAAASLTEREREVAILMARGLTNADIGARLHMSLATVKANLTRVFTKLGVDNRVSAAMSVRDAGLLDD